MAELTELNFEVDDVGEGLKSAEEVEGSPSSSVC